MFFFPAASQQRILFVKRRILFTVDSDMPPADTVPYERWRQWRDGPSTSAVAFLSAEERGAIAARFHARLLLDGLDLPGVDLLTKWAAPDLEQHEALLLLALFETATDYFLDVTAGDWTERPKESPAASQHTDATATEASLQQQIDECEARLQELRGPAVPMLDHAALLKLMDSKLPWVWQRDVTQALLRFIKSETTVLARAGQTLARDVWRALYRTAESQSHASPGRSTAVPGTFVPPSGPPGPCFRCGFHGHWARDCATAAPVSHPSQPPPAPGFASQAPSAANPSLSQSAPLPVPTPTRRGGFTQIGSQTLYTAYSTGRTYDASGPPPYPCSRCSKMHWSWQGCPPPNPSPAAPPGAQPAAPTSPGSVRSLSTGPHGDPGPPCG